MARWLSYTVGLREDADPDVVLATLGDAVDDELLAASKYDDPDYLLPEKHPEWGVLSKRVGRTGVLTQWLAAVVSDITVMYFTSVQNTVDEARVRVFEPTDRNKLGEVDERKGTLETNRRTWDDDEYFPEYAMSIHPQSFANHRLTIDREVDHLHELEAKYGARPLIHYA